MSGDGLLTLRDVAVARGGLPVLAGVSFAIAPGEALVLRGPNGSGKTTLLRAIAGLQPVDAGAIEADPDAIAYAAHADGIKGTLTVAENLSFWAGLFGTDDISRALSAFNLVDLADRPAQALSAGQKRRLGLSRLIVTGRPVWALDEPTVSLDRASVGLFADAVRGHMEMGGAAVMATHIDLGIDARELDLTGYRAALPTSGAFDEAFQ
ncbi:MAG: heme ABC exporter ATP-binding protein CcmA [Paracoccaceae bacterium]|nr:heme ABC exporter ATP-binding protein CcmA [Paracoccaceae bacterium]